MDASDLRSRLASAPLLVDGGMGTSLIDRGMPVDACAEIWSIERPEEVAAVHRGFVEAGARMVLTNTFGANRYRLERHGHGDRVGELCAAATEIARSSGAEIVGGSMGPLGVRLMPYGRVRPDDAFDAYLMQASVLAEAGVDLLVLETQTDLRELEQAVIAAREGAPGLPVIASATFTRDDRTLLGSTPAEVAAALAAIGVDALGVNCAEGPAQVLRIARDMAPFAAGIPLVARPNAGGPASIGGRLVYPATPEYLGEVAAELVDAGVRVVGGCCGTGPAHTRAMAGALRETTRGPRVAFPPPSVQAPASPRAAAPPTTLERHLTEGRFAVTVEMEPPRSFNAAELVVAADTLREAGATAIDVADSPMAKMRMSAWAACRLVQDRVGIETVLHFPTRGRNLLRLQGDLLGAYALGIRNLFVCVGDPVTIGDYPQSLNDVDVTATGLLKMVTEAFNTGVDRGGATIGEPTAFFAGAAVSPAAADLEREAKLLARKVRAGARFLLTQPLYSAEPLAGLRAEYERHAGEPLTAPVLAGVLPLASARHARFLHNEVPGIRIPDAALLRMERAGDGDQAWAEGLAMATEQVAALRAGGAAGVYVMPQFGRYDRAAQLVEAIHAAV